MTDSWLDTPEHTGFGLDNLPHGVVVQDGRAPQVAIAVGQHALPLGAATEAGLFDGVVPDTGILTAPSLDRLLAAGPTAWQAVRDRATELLGTPATPPPCVRCCSSSTRCRTRCRSPSPTTWTSTPRATTRRTSAGCSARTRAPLLPNWTHLPIGYHGRAGTVVVSGTAIAPPARPAAARARREPVFGPTTRLDIEAEVGFVVGVPTRLGQTVSVDEFADHVFGAVLVNDWSARDIQAWEYQPLGPFLGKSFATSVSPWVVPLAALAEARVAPPRPGPGPAALPARRPLGLRPAACGWTSTAPPSPGRPSQGSTGPRRSSSRT